MKILTDEAEDKLVSIIGTAIVLIIAILIIGLIGWVEVGMWTRKIGESRNESYKSRVRFALTDKQEKL